MIMKVLSYSIIFLLVASCSGSADPEQAAEVDGVATTAAQAFPKQILPGYALAEPSQVYVLPSSLNEISGLQYLEGGVLAINQDEEGILYFFELERGRVVEEVAWGKGRDYEGVTGSKDKLYVLESDGDIYAVHNPGKQQAPVVEELEAELPDDCDAEGLFLLKDKNWLLISCKGGSRGIRNIWAFDLRRKKLMDKPFLQLSARQVEQALVKDGLDRFSLGLKKMLDGGGESDVLSPSAIARHPLTQDYYVLSSKSKLLLVYNDEGELKYVEELANSLFRQPESITFSPAGDMFIGNEADGAEPNILMFTYER